MRHKCLFAVVWKADCILSEVELHFWQSGMWLTKPSARQWLHFLLSGEPQLGRPSIYLCFFVHFCNFTLIFLNHLKVSSQDCVSGPLLIPWPSSRILIFPGLESWLAYSPCLDFFHPKGTFSLFSVSTILSKATVECGILVLYCV